MDLILGVLWLAGVMWAGKHALQHVTAQYRKARGNHAAKAAAGGKRPARRRHAVAWWAREARHGFPVTRAGFGEGWQAHQTAMEQARARREENRTSHLEARASVAEEMRLHWMRQEAALDRVDRVLLASSPHDEPDPPPPPRP